MRLTPRFTGEASVRPLATSLQNALLAVVAATALNGPIPLAVQALEPAQMVTRSTVQLIADGEGLAPITPPDIPAEPAIPAPPAPLPPPAPPAPPAKVDIAYTELKQLLNQCIDGSSAVCLVERVDFDDAMGETGTVVVEGQRLKILDIPEDNSNNDSRCVAPHARILRIRTPRLLPVLTSPDTAPCHAAHTSWLQSYVTPRCPSPSPSRGS